MGLNMEEFVFMPGGPLIQTVTVETLTDMIVEEDETLSMWIDDITGPAQTGNPSVNLTIINDDCKSTYFHTYIYSLIVRVV